MRCLVFLCHLSAGRESYFEVLGLMCLSQLRGFFFFEVGFLPGRIRLTKCFHVTSHGENILGVLSPGTLMTCLNSDSLWRVILQVFIRVLFNLVRKGLFLLSASLTPSCIWSLFGKTAQRECVSHNVEIPTSCSPFTHNWLCEHLQCPR